MFDLHQIGDATSEVLLLSFFARSYRLCSSALHCGDGLSSDKKLLL